jgi:hypothetical protein
MSALLRQRHLTRICFTCLEFRRIRLHSSHAILAAPQDVASLSLNPNPITIQANEPLSTLSKPSSKLRGKNTKSVKNTQDDITQKDPFAHNGVELYLNKLKAAGLEPTLFDLERCKPLRRHRPDTARYEQQFEALVDRLSRSFSKRQLCQFCEMYQIDARPYVTKRKLVLGIIEKRWGWPSLDEIKRRKIEETKIEQACTCVLL